MEETELAEIESRILEYPVEARRDIIKLMGEVRGLRELDLPPREPDRTSPLYDPVTAVLNGGAYGVRFAGAMARAMRNKKRFAVMSIDLSNASEKPAMGDEDAALKLVAQRLEQCVRAADTLARIDEERFAIILEDLTADGQVNHVTEKVQRALSEPAGPEGKKIYPGSSISIRVYPSPE